MDSTDTTIRSLAHDPLLLSALGLGPLAVISYSLLTGLIAASIFTLVLCFSTVTIFVVRYFVPRSYRLIMILMVTATFVTIIELFLQAYFYEISLAFNIYIPIMAMNALLLASLEGTVLTGKGKVIFQKLFFISMIVILLLTITGAVRELLLNGSVLTDMALYFPTQAGTVPSTKHVLLLFSSSSGAFLALGCTLAVARYFFPSTTKRV